MIVVDTSALLAVVLDEPMAAVCGEALEAHTAVIVSAGSLAEAMIVANARGVAHVLAKLMQRLDLEVVPVTLVTAQRMGDAYARWGKGFNPAGLNFGDCFAYVTAIEHGCPLLYVGNDFARTDVASAL